MRIPLSGLAIVQMDAPLRMEAPLQISPLPRASGSPHGDKASALICNGQICIGLAQPQLARLECSLGGRGVLQLNKPIRVAYART